MTNKVHGRHGSRWAAVQGLYAWSLSGAPIGRIEDDLRANHFYSIIPGASEQLTPAIKVSFDKDYLHELLIGITGQVSSLDDLITPHIERDLSEINPVEHAILRVAMYELKDKKETPYRVIINEAILLAKQFGATDSHKFINGVLDKAVRVLRAGE